VEHAIAVVIVTFNSVHVVGDLLDSLPAALEGLAADVVVVDNASTDGTAQALESRDDCQVVRASNNGYSAGINLGVSASRAAGPVLVLNPDVRLRAGAVRFLVESLELPGTGIVAPRVVNPDGSLFRSLRREPTVLRATGLSFTGLAALSEYVTDEDEYKRPHVVNWALGAALLISRPCFDELNGWDESYFLYSEETDFCLRAGDIGWVTRYDPRAEVLHIGGQSGRSDQTHILQVLNRVRLYRRRHSYPTSFVYFSLTFLSETVWAVRGQRQSLASVRALLGPTHRPTEFGEGRLLAR
jgi:N-acetylglucosaminyl-diphospho-decaprenol L-rhamnosyltransferase